MMQVGVTDQSMIMTNPQPPPSFIYSDVISLPHTPTILASRLYWVVQEHFGLFLNLSHTN